ncbi:MAG: DsbA family oxidoreductase [Bacteroidetes bacterium]|nr:DsbA family oxidoreductase [Bacteroidota bacterium]
MTRPLVEIEIISDVVCPWCYIGKRRLEKAMAKRRDAYEFKTWFSPFELNPSLPEEGINHHDYLISKFGGGERFDEITAYVTETAREEGLTFRFDKNLMSPNTRFAHRVLWTARSYGMQADLKEMLMSSYFEKGVDLTGKERIIKIAKELGLPDEVCNDLLNTDLALQDVIEAEALHHRRGITGVPFYIINNRFGISGAQKPETFIQAFDQITKQT